MTAETIALHANMKSSLKTQPERPCCHCTRGMIPGNRPSDMWKTCPDCNGTGYGTNIFRTLQSVCRNGSYASEEIVCWPGRIHARDQQSALEYIHTVFNGALVCVEPV